MAVKRKAKARKSSARKTVKRKTAVKRKTTARKTRKKAVRKTATKRKAKRKSSGKRTSGLTKTSYAVSPELAAVVGGKNMTRPEIVKKLWAYIKSHKLQDAKNRRMINPDAKLGEVIGRRPVDMMKLAGLLSKHIK